MVDAPWPIAIIGTLVGLLLPAVQAAREAARRSSCTNNLKQIGVALHAFHDGNRRFPYGHIYPQDNLNYTGDKLFGSWVREILPFMELKDVYNKFVGTAVWYSPSNQTVRSYKLPAFLCPSDRDVPTFNTSMDFGARGNHAANAGIGKWNRSVPWSAAYQPDLTTRGPFLLASYTTIAKITDGLSKTAAVTEIRKSPNNDSRGALFADSGCNQIHTAICRTRPPATLRSVAAATEPLRASTRVALVRTRSPPRSSTPAG